jgi:hypothetical protein
MSIIVVRKIRCRTCGEPVEGVTLDSANPVRHPHFQARLIDRTLQRMRCPACDAEHLHYDRMTWIDLPGYLCAMVVHDSERPDWSSLETATRQSLSVPLLEEGPGFVRVHGGLTAIRLVFGFEELREKVICRVNTLDDRVVEAMKEALPYGSMLEAATPGAWLTFRDGERALEVPWQTYDDTAARADELADAFPGIFDESATWVSAARARRPPRE